MIDLHLHTTASDGALTPSQLVDHARGAGVRTLSVTDHDTMAGVPEAADAAARHQLEFLPGVEITTTLDGKNVHLLAYFLDPEPPTMAAFLEERRAERVARARFMADRLAGAGVGIDIEPIIERTAAEGRSIARPLLAVALVEAGHARSQREAFDRWIGNNRPAYVPCRGVTPVEAVRHVSKAGGITSLAHPGLLGKDHVIPGLARDGLTALEAHHPEHDPASRSRYVRLAEQNGLAVSGGSDFHDQAHRRGPSLGRVGLSRETFMPLLQCLLQAHSAARPES